MKRLRYSLIGPAVFLSACGAPSSAAETAQAAEAVNLPVSGQATPGPGITDWVEYRNAEYAFGLYYPPEFDLVEQPSDWPGDFPMILSELEEPISLVSIPPEVYEDTNLDGASLLVTVYGGSCSDDGAAWDGEGGDPVEINGIRFLERKAASSTPDKAALLEIYETAVGRDCYRLILNTQFSRLEEGDELTDFREDLDSRRYLADLGLVLISFTLDR